MIRGTLLWAVTEYKLYQSVGRDSARTPQRLGKISRRWFLSETGGYLGVAQEVLPGRQAVLHQDKFVTYRAGSVHDSL